MNDSHQVKLTTQKTSLWRRYAPYWLRNFIERVYNLYRWFPIIWKDQDWDDYYIFEILKFKLKNQAKYISECGNHVSAERDAEIMTLCVRLIDRLQDDYYGCEYQDYAKTNIKFVDSETYPGHYEMELEYITDNLDDYFRKYPRIYKQVEGKDRYHIAFRIASKNQERANRLLFKILEQNITRWWD